MTPELQSVINDSRALLEKAGPAFRKVAELEEQALSLSSKVASLEQQKLARDESIKTAALKAAAFFGDRGMLKCSADEFASALQSDPSQIFEVIQGFVDSSTMKEAGLPEGQPSDLGAPDPIVSFALK